MQKPGPYHERPTQTACQEMVFSIAMAVEKHYDRGAEKETQADAERDPRTTRGKHGAALEEGVLPSLQKGYREVLMRRLRKRIM